LYPPHSIDDARGLAQGTTLNLSVAKAERLYLPPCTCRLNVLVPPGLSKPAMAAALLKVFFDNNLDGQLEAYGGDGRVFVFGWTKRSDIGNISFTAGLVEVIVSQGKHTMAIDAGYVPYDESEHFSY
jgi:hypothetical protein